MLRRAIKYLFLLLVLSNCGTDLTPPKQRIFVVQEFRLDGNNSFFWFREEQEITHEGLSYFQISDDKCKLSVKNANAYCESPEQIFDFRNDTVFVLSRSEIHFLKPLNHYSISVTDYSNELYDMNKKPKKQDMYFLDSACHN